MTGKNIHEIRADREVDPTTGFEATFSPLAIHEILLEFDPKHWGPPLIVLGRDGGATKEIHPLPQRGRGDGRFVARLDGTESYDRIRVSLAPRGKKARLVAIKLIAPGAT